MYCHTCILFLAYDKHRLNQLRDKVTYHTLQFPTVKHQTPIHQTKMNKYINSKIK